MPDSHVMTFRREKFTPNTVRFIENVSDEEPRGVPFLYMTKWLYEKLDKPDSLQLTVQAENRQQ